MKVFTIVKKVNVLLESVDPIVDNESDLVYFNLFDWTLFIHRWSAGNNERYEIYYQLYNYILFFNSRTVHDKNQSD